MALITPSANLEITYELEPLPRPDLGATAPWWTRWRP